MAKVSRLLGGSVLCAIGSLHPGFALTLDDVRIDPSEVPHVCRAIEGEHPVSIQPAVQYKMAGDDEAGRAVYGNPRRKQFQSFECQRTMATIYYYEYETRDELDRRLSSIKTILWGEAGPTKMHPELVLDADNLLMVVSSRQPEFLAALLSHHTSFPDLPDDTLDRRMAELRCGTPKTTASEVCSVDCYSSVYQSEWATDVMFQDAASLAVLYPSLVMRFLSAPTEL